MTFQGVNISFFQYLVKKQSNQMSFSYLPDVCNVVAVEQKQKFPKCKCLDSTFAFRSRYTELTPHQLYDIIRCRQLIRYCASVCVPTHQKAVREINIQTIPNLRLLQFHLNCAQKHVKICLQLRISFHWVLKNLKYTKLKLVNYLILQE